MRGFVRALRIVLVFLGLLAFSALAVTGVFAVVGESEAESEIQEAVTALSSVYVAVLEAERSGADVSGLLVGLSSGGDLLAEAQMRYRNGDFDGAVYYADLSVESVEGLMDEAGQLKALALAEHEERSFVTVAGSGVAVVVIVLASVVGWRLLKRRYLSKVLEMKPEVVEG